MRFAYDSAIHPGCRDPGVTEDTMSRLRIRVELSHGGMGVPLHKLTSVTGEFHKFLNLLTEVFPNTHYIFAEL